MLIENAKVVNVFTGEIDEGNIALAGEFIAGIGDYKEGKGTADLQGKYVCPGFINAHVHIESSMLDIPEFSRLVVPRGTLGVVTDLHELANVLGVEGIRYASEINRNLPLDFYFMAPSCVPATSLETSGAVVTSDDLAEVMNIPGIIGLGEMMNYPGVLNCDEEVLKKLELYESKLIDGHAPGLKGKDLTAYIAAGIHTDHESVTLEEAREKLAKGMHVIIREGSSEKNLEALLPLVTDKTYKRCMLATDDRSVFDIFNEGDMDYVVYRAIKLGLDPVRAIQMATINTAEYYGMKRVGAVAPGYYANFVTFADLETIEVEDVLYRGYLMGMMKEPNFTPRVPKIARPVDTINIKSLTPEAFKMKPTAEKMPVINIVPGQIITKKTMETPKLEDGWVVSDIERDILKIAVVERHHATGNIGLGLIKGFGLRKGAVAASISHDSHNVIIVGTNDDDMIAAVREIEMMQGGLVMTLKGEAIGRMALPVGGILSTDTAEDAGAQLHDLETLVKVMGVAVQSPFTVLSFMALPVIGEIRITDKGIVDVGKFKIIK
ncbi:MAG: adenine deaminase [Dehalococcoidaceae bacterium]|nr:adenine deaminase [Dehalococcoidaceae bacterium]